MKQKIVLTSFDVSAFDPVIQRRKRHHPRSGRVPLRSSKPPTCNLTALRRAWRAMAQTPPLFAVRVRHD